MPSWNDLVTEFDALPDRSQKENWLNSKLREWLQKVRAKRSDRNVIFYASGFFQKLTVQPYLVQIIPDDINGFMANMHGMDWSKNLTLILHTPGGATNATETLVEYLHQKFADIEVIIPAAAMSAGTMISLAANRLIMGRASQLGPIDPQIPFGGRTFSARGIEDQFTEARTEILADHRVAPVWAPVLQSLGPSLLMEARQALAYSEQMVKRWLSLRSFPQDSNKAAAVAHYFNRAQIHTSHGRRIDRDEARGQSLTVEDLETDQQLQEAVLTAYHLVTLMFEKSPATKLIANDQGTIWVKNVPAPPPAPGGP